MKRWIFLEDSFESEKTPEFFYSGKKGYAQA